MFMDNGHILLIFFWVIFCLLHSFFADERVKQFFFRLMGRSAPYYRLIYSLFAASSLMAILWFQLDLEGPYLFSFLFFRLTGIVILLPGLWIMWITIRKYFYELSGVKVFFDDKPGDQSYLETTGLHSWVRHPLYLGTLLFAWGLFMLFPRLENLIAVVMITAYTLIGIRLEEKKLLNEFGDAYRNYRSKVPMLLPDLLKKKKGS